MNHEDFLKRNRISGEEFAAANINFDSLIEIYEHHTRNLPKLNEAAQFLATVLQKCEEVHSVRWRIKDAEHLLEKIVRKKASKSKKYENISVENYENIITDLVGVRVLHLFKHEWSNIDDYIRENWKLLEKAVAYIRQGDEGNIIKDYKSKNCKVEVHKAGYRSVHYIVVTNPTLKKIFSEIQVRTIFEEGWSEIDHRVRYPNFTDNQLVSYFLTIFNRMAGSADEMGTFVNLLSKDLTLSKIDLESKLSKIEELTTSLTLEKKAGHKKNALIKSLKEETKGLRVGIENSQSHGFISNSFDLHTIVNPLGKLNFSKYDEKIREISEMYNANILKSLEAVRSLALTPSEGKSKDD